MSRNPYGTDELDRLDPDLDRVADELERYAASERGEPAVDLAGRVHAAVDAEPDPPLGWRRSLPATLRAWRAPARGLALAAMLVVAVVGALAVSELIERARNGDVGTSPTPAVISPSPSPSLSATPSPSPSPSPSPTVAPTPPPATPVPSASESEDESESAEPSESDNSGPGGGGGDDGDGDNSGPGGGDD